jgi:hypothetical protein
MNAGIDADNNADKLVANGSGAVRRRMNQRDKA